MDTRPGAARAYIWGMKRVCHIAATLACLWAGSAANALPTIIVDRAPDGTTVYFGLEADGLPGLFGQGADALLTPQGVVDVDALYDGTFDTADEIFAGVEATIDGAPAVFEATSMMVHDPAILPAFNTPYDAAISVAICNSPETVANMGLDELVAFMGFYAWKADPSGDILLTLPQTDRPPVTFEIRDHASTGALVVSLVTVASGETLRIAAPTATPDTKIPPAIGAAVAAIAAGGVVWLFLMGGAPLMRRRA
ncbi:MAG: hypothetical protein AAFN59_00495 [Pseudomonadota bacterium]